MTLDEKKIREDIDSLLNEMTGITKAAKDAGRDLTDEEVTRHEEIYSQIQQHQVNLGVMSREKQVQDSLNGKPVDQHVPLTPSKMAAVDKREKAVLNVNTAKIFSAITSKDLTETKRNQVINDAQKQLFEAGYYPQFENSVEAFTTLTDGDGGILIPEVVTDRIFDISREYGVFTQFALRFPITENRVKIPNLLGALTFYAVNEGAEAKASRVTFKGILLDKLKWMAYVPWTNEIDEAKGAVLVDIITRKLAEALAYMRDNAIMNADGTSTFHNLKGFVTRSASSDFPEVRLSTAAAGNTSFATVDPDDILDASLDLAPSIRDRARLVMHTDWKVRLKKMKDADNIPFYRGGEGVISVVDGQYFIHGIPVDFSEAAPNTDGTNEEYAIMYVPEYFAFGDDGLLSIEQFNTGTIKDENDADINLLSQDMKALRVKTYFDFELSNITVSSGGNSLGAFTVLRTNNS